MSSHLLKWLCRRVAGVVLALIWAAWAPYAEGDTLKPIKPIQKAGKPAAMSIQVLPDLVANPPSWSSPPREGDPIGSASILNIAVKNQGIAAAGASKLKIACQLLTGPDCPDGLEGTLDIPPLDPGQAMNIAWPPANFAEKWVPGQYRLTFTTDFASQVPESIETNNTRLLTFTVPSKMGLGKIKQLATVSQPPAAAAILALPVQSPAAGSEHAAGQPLPIKWNKSLVGAYPTVDILLVGAQDGQVRETIKSGAANSGEYHAWTAPQAYAWPGTSYMVRIITPDSKISGQSGAFTIGPPKEKKKVLFMRDAVISNGWAYTRGGDLRPHDCLSAQQVQPGRQPGSQEAKIGHFAKEASHGECRYYDEYYFRSRITFDLEDLKGKEIVEAALLIRLGETIELYPPGNNSQVTSQCDIYLLNGPWPASPQPLYDFYPGAFLQSFSLFGEGETAKVDLLTVAQGWAAGQVNQGLMLRGPVNRTQYVPSAAVKYYHSVKLVGWYLE